MTLSRINFWVGVVFIFVSSFDARASAVNGVRLWESPESTRVVFDLKSPVQHNVFMLANPRRLVIDFDRKQMPVKLGKLDLGTSAVSKIRVGQSNDSNKTRVVLDLRHPVKPNSFVLDPYKQYGHRLVLDLFARDKKKSSALSKPKKTIKNIHRDIVIAIDPGHGGEDPGAIGGGGTYEKEVTLAVAKQLKKIIDKEPGMRAVLTRTGDYFVRLRKRQKTAREHRADLFISIHADSFPDKRAKGASVWVVSHKGARSEVGRWLEQRENTSDLLGGVEPINDKDPVLAELLLELSMDYSVGESFGVAQSVLKNMGKHVYKVHRKTVQEAAFVVLKAPDITSILVEAAFISNPKEEQLLKSLKYQKKLARGIFQGVKKYYRTNPPEGTLYAKLARTASTRHTIQKGETLSYLAQKFGTTVKALRNENRLKTDRLLVGQTIKIPR